MNKKEKAIKLIKEKLGADRDYDEAIEEAVEKTAEKMQEKFVKEVHLPSNVVIQNLKEEIEKAVEGKTMKAEVQNDVLDVRTRGKTQVEGKVEVTNSKQNDNSSLVSFLASTFERIINFLEDLQKRTYSVEPTADARTTPQAMILYDPDTMSPVSPSELGAGGLEELNIGGAHASAPSKVGIRGSDTIETGTLTVDTAGTRKQFPDKEIDRVYVQAHVDNSGTVVIGGSNVVAAKANREGLALANLQWQPFTPKNLNQLWADATENGDKVNYIYEA